jgi:PAS domain-containing protein
VSLIVSQLRGKIRESTGELHIEIDERKQAEKALRESEANLRTLIKTIPDVVWFKDLQGIYRFCNSRLEDLFGVKEQGTDQGTELVC